LKLVQAILKEMSFRIAWTSISQKQLTADMMPGFSADLLKEYEKDGEETPLRKELLKASAELDRLSGANLTDTLRDAPVPQLKMTADQKKKEAARVISQLMEVSDSLKA